MIGAMVSYALMNLVMTSAPLAMKLCGLSVSDSNFGIQWHILAMYGPSFFTGALIARFDAPKIVAAGLLLVTLDNSVLYTALPTLTLASTVRSSKGSL